MPSYDDYFSSYVPGSGSRSSGGGSPFAGSDYDWLDTYKEEESRPSLPMRAWNKINELTPWSKRDAERREEIRQGAQSLMERYLPAGLTLPGGINISPEAASRLDPRWVGSQLGELTVGSPAAMATTLATGGTAGLLSKAIPTAARLARPLTTAGRVIAGTGAGIGGLRTLGGAQELWQTGGESGYGQVGQGLAELGLGYLGARAPSFPDLPTARQAGEAIIPEVLPPVGPVKPRPRQLGPRVLVPEPPAPQAGIIPESRRLSASFPETTLATPEPVQPPRFLAGSGGRSNLGVTDVTQGPFYYDPESGQFFNAASLEQNIQGEIGLQAKRVPSKKDPKKFTVQMPDEQTQAAIRTGVMSRIREVPPETAANQLFTGQRGLVSIDKGRKVPYGQWETPVEQVGVPTEIQVRGNRQRITQPFTEEIGPQRPQLEVTHHPPTYGPAQGPEQSPEIQELIDRFAASIGKPRTPEPIGPMRNVTPRAVPEVPRVPGIPEVPGVPLGERAAGFAQRRVDPVLRKVEEAINRRGIAQAPGDVIIPNPSPRTASIMQKHGYMAAEELPDGGQIFRAGKGATPFSRIDLPKAVEEASEEIPLTQAQDIGRPGPVEEIPEYRQQLGPTKAGETAPQFRVGEDFGDIAHDIDDYTDQVDEAAVKAAQTTGLDMSEVGKGSAFMNSMREFGKTMRAGYDRYYTSPQKMLERLGGDTGKQIYNMLGMARADAAAESAKVGAQMDKVLKDLSPDEITDLTHFLTGETRELASPKAMAAAEEIKGIYTGLTGRMMATHPTPQTFTARPMMEKVFAQGTFEKPELQERLRQMGMKASHVSRLGKKGGKYVNIPPPEYQRYFRGVTGYKTDKDSLINYYKTLAGDVGKQEVLGARVLGANSNIRKLIEGADTNQANKDEMLKTVQYVMQGSKGADARHYDFYRRVNSAMVAMKLSNMLISNTAQLGMIPIQNNFKSFAKALGQTVTRNPDANVQAVMSGALEKVGSEFSNVVKPQGLIMKGIGKGFGIEFSEKMQRKVGALAGRTAAESWFEVLKRDPSHKEARERLGTYLFGENVDEVLQQAKLTDKQLNRAGFRGAELSQGLAETLDLPQGRVVDPFMRIPFIFSKYAFTGTKLLKDSLFGSHLTTGQKLKNAATWAAMSQVAGMGIGLGKDTARALWKAGLSGDPGSLGEKFGAEREKSAERRSKFTGSLGKAVAGENEELFNNIVSNMMQSWMLGIPGDVTHSVMGGARPMLDQIVGPAVTTGVDFGADLVKMGFPGESGGEINRFTGRRTGGEKERWEPFARDVLQNVPLPFGGGRALQETLLPAPGRFNKPPRVGF